jgi:UDP-glucose 4-epimerase
VERDVRSVVPCDPVLAGANYVVYFARIGDIVPSIDRPIEYMSTNVMGALHTPEAARHAGCDGEAGFFVEFSG